ncbi:probable carboxypeptidase X1 [Patella vulgata]|uniref:probable carboxypeptidase X1 n=1 Tax=Patella vulgata TaxID=6465 RepID=UPI0024A97A2C|nr:probable carboxypeptidase X1 [Patella vulgata]
MGLENYRIVTDSQLTASSQIDKDHGPTSGRLTVVDQSNVSWVPKSTDTNRWIQVDFLERKSITGTVVQGGSEYGWVSKYNTSATTKTITFITPTVTGSTTEGTTTKVCMIPMGVESRYVINLNQLTASSQIDISHGADQGRIYNTAVNGHGSAWMPL